MKRERVVGPDFILSNNIFYDILHNIFYDTLYNIFYEMMQNIFYDILHNIFFDIYYTNYIQQYKTYNTSLDKPERPLIEKKYTYGSSLYSI